ncbi:MAG TPA: hypothetical protein VGD74_09550 [Vulgatibacter sp.]
MAESLPTDRFDLEERIRRDLETARQEFATSVLALRHRVASPFDWRGFVRRRPIAVLVGGAITGFTIALWTSARWKEDP